MAVLDLTTYLTLKNLIGLLLVYYFASALHQWLCLRHIPGPFLAGFTHLWLFHTALSGREPFTFHRLATHHSPSRLIRVSPTLLLTSDPEILRKMSATRSPYGKDASYHASLRHPDVDNMFSTTDIPTHDAKKAKLLGAYGGREFHVTEPIVDQMLERLIASLLRGGPQTVNLCDTAPRFTMDVILRMALGKDLRYLDGTPDAYNLMKFTYATTMPFALALAIPWFRDFVGSRFAKAFLAPKATDKAGIGPFIR